MLDFAWNTMPCEQLETNCSLGRTREKRTLKNIILKIVSVAFLLILTCFILEQSISDRWELRLMFPGRKKTIKPHQLIYSFSIQKLL